MIKKRNQKVTGILISLLAFPFLALAQSPVGTSQIGVTEFALSMLLFAVVIGVVYNLWKITKSFGGIIGDGMRRIGIGIIFLVIEAFDRALQVFGLKGIINGLISVRYAPVAHDLLIAFALLFVTIGFTKFYSATKA